MNPEKHVLGPLCKNGHDHEGIGQSLRYRSTRQCVACMDERRGTYGKTYYDQNAERLRAKARENYWADHERHLEAMAAYRKTQAFKDAQRRYRKANRAALLEAMKEWKRQNRERVRAYNAWHYWTHLDYHRARQVTYLRTHAAEVKCRQGDYRKRNRPARLEALRRWRQSPHGRLHRLLAQRRREALKRGSRAVPYTPEQLGARFAAFGLACAYCGATGDLVSDHLVPLSRGGADVLTNIVPACGPCNQSKYNNKALTWYRAQPFFSEERWARLQMLL